MPKICVKAPEIVMSGDVNINAGMAVSTKAKLESVSVGGDCLCGSAPPPPLVTDYVIVIDGSDSYNNKVTLADSSVDDAGAFVYTQKWAGGLIKNLANHEKAANTTVTLVQFSGYKQLEKNYVPGSDGCDKTGLNHYVVEIAPTRINNADALAKQAEEFDALDGNGQLFLCLQDVSMAAFHRRLANAGSSPNRRTCLIVVSDEEWDIKHLKQAPEFGSGTATADGVCKNVHDAFDAVHAVIVRPNRFQDQNEEFITGKLCKPGNHYYKVYTDSFENDMNTAGSGIMNNMDYANNGLQFF